MARFDNTVGSLQRLTAAIAGVPVPGAGQSTQSARSNNSDSLAQSMIDVLQKEDYNAIKIALLCDKLITKFKGRSV